MPNHNIQLLIFDLGDVLIDIDVKRHDHTLTDAFAQPVDAETVRRLIGYEGDAGQYWGEAGWGRLTADELLDKITETSNYRGERQALHRATTDIFSPMAHRVALFRKLIARDDIDVVMLSDTCALHIDHIEQVIPEVFETLSQEKRFYSNRIGARKKYGSDAYLHVLKACSVAPENALMIDDQPRNKIGADAIGLNFCLVQKDEDLEAKLRDWGIL